jgi:hypothetical protein
VRAASDGCRASAADHGTRLRSWDLHNFQLNLLDSPWLEFGLNRRSTMDAVSIGTQVSGQTIKTIGDRCQTFSPRRISLTDFGSPYQWRSTRDADAISPSPAASMIGQATTDLVRAALVSAVDEEPFRTDGWGQSRITVAKSYIAQHLADPDLGPEAIARAMFIATRPSPRSQDVGALPTPRTSAVGSARPTAYHRASGGTPLPRLAHGAK